MILTKDNLLRHVRERKYVTPTTVSEDFDTTTMIASAALSEIAKEKLIGITHLKLSSTPYYYDPRQPECLQELAEKHFKEYDKESYNLIKENQVLNDSQLTIQQRIAMQRIEDFATPLEIDHEGKTYKFWIWYLRDMAETTKQIKDVLNPKKEAPKANQKQKRQAPKPQTQRPSPSPEITHRPNLQQQMQSPFENPAPVESESKSELFIENYFRQNYLKIENKNKTEKYVRYTTSLVVNKMKIVFDCIFYFKKPAEAEVLKFYTSSNKPKIVFVEAAPKKLFKLAENLDNFEMVNI